MKKLLPLLVLLLIVALAAVGVGYGMWFEELFVDGTVRTGTLDVEWSMYDEPAEWDTGYDYELKPWVANCEQEFVGDTMFIRAKNVYPCWHCLAKFDVTSKGTIPVHVAFEEFEELWASGPFDYPTVKCKDKEGNEYINGDWKYVQLHEGESLVCWIHIHGNNEGANGSPGLEQRTEYKFGWKIMAAQFNEYP